MPRLFRLKSFAASLADKNAQYFYSLPVKVAQSVERWTTNPWTQSSIPAPVRAEFFFFYEVQLIMSFLKLKYSSDF